MTDTSDSELDDERRQQLLERVNRKTATVGASIPDSITVGGTEIDLSEFLIETRRVEGVPPETAETLDAVKRTLRNERTERRERLETDALDVATGERLADEIIGIDRALNALENIRRPDFGDESRSASMADHKRWVGFLNDIRG